MKCRICGREARWFVPVDGLLVCQPCGDPIPGVAAVEHDPASAFDLDWLWARVAWRETLAEREAAIDRSFAEALREMRE